MLDIIFYLFGLFFIIVFVDFDFLDTVFQFMIFLFCFLLFFYLMGVFGYNFWICVFYDFGFDKVSLVMFFCWLSFLFGFYDYLLLEPLYLLVIILFESFVVWLFLFFCSINFVYFYIFF